MGELSVNRWTRYGKDRLYVNTECGAKVGWVDLRSGRVTLERLDLALEFERAVVAYREEHGVPTPGTSSARRGGSGAVAASEQPPAPPGGDPCPTPPPPPTASDRLPPPSRVRPPSTMPPSITTPPGQEPFAIRIDWEDLGQRAPGEAAADQARTERQAAPVRTFAARLLGVHTDERAWRIGAKGEQLAAQELERLSIMWKAIHAIPVGDRGADIDHLVVGPGGVFTVNAKHHPDARIWVGGNTFIVNGTRQPYVRNSRHEARRASRLLSHALGWKVAVTGVIAVIGARGGMTIKAQPEDVKVVGRRQLAAWLDAQPFLLPPQRVSDVYRAARRSDTWM